VSRSPIERVAVLGAGSWGTTFAKVLADAGRSVVLWARRAEVAEAVRRDRQNPDYLPGVRLPEGLECTVDAGCALTDADAVVLAMPSQLVREHLNAWRGQLPAECTVLSLVKGVELDTLKRMSEVIVEVGDVPIDRVAVLSGPNLAREIAAEQPTATVVACADHSRAVLVQQACGTGYFRPYTNTDVVGCELAGACKNVVALACGIAVGKGYGANTVASLITRGLAETARLGAAYGADPMTFAGLAGLGDMVVTCCSPLSRNRSFGERLGCGETLAQAELAGHGQIAEGVTSCVPIRALAAKHGVDMPIADSVYRVCYEHLTPEQMAAELLGRSHKPE
jgi:glycerol-3-phosphate dehydrogenase (NAD(P)+)